MTEQTNTNAAKLVEALQQLSDNAQSLESALDELKQSLVRRGIALPEDLLERVWDMKQQIWSAQRQSELLSGQLDKLQGLVHSSALITSSLELNQVLEQVMDTVISLTGADRAYLMLRDQTDDELTIRAARNWDHETLPEGDVVFSRSVIVAALEQGTPIVTTNAQSDARFQSHTSIVSHGLRAILCIPLVLNGQIEGVLYADNRIRQGIFSVDNIPLLAAFGTQAAIAIDKARLHGDALRRERLDEELAVGRRIQFSLLPRDTPTSPGWDFAVVYSPARVVGGDFYDFFTISPERLGLVIADVADKGVPAALFMAVSRTIIRTTGLSRVNPAAALMRANQLILNDTSQSGLFLSAFYGILDMVSGQFVFTNGGHNRPLLLRKDSNTFEELTVPGIVLGLFEDIKLQDSEVEIAPGDTAFFYTDGITEAMDPDHNEFGVERLCKAILEARQKNAQQVLMSITEAVKAFTQDAEQSDDFTLIVVKREVA